MNSKTVNYMPETISLQMYIICNFISKPTVLIDKIKFLSLIPSQYIVNITNY